MIRVGMSTDSRIGNKFLFPGLGYGGSCFHIDVKALIKTGLNNHCEMTIIKATDEINKKQRSIFIDKIRSYFGDDLVGRTFAICGLAFKPKNEDLREAPSIAIINDLLKEGQKLRLLPQKQ